MEILTKKLEELINSLSSENRVEIRDRLENLFSVYPFNEYEYIISTLLALKKISLDDYYEIRDEYIARNMFLYIFEITGPRTFGEQWAQGHLKELVPSLIKPSKKLDPNYSGQYDFFLRRDNSDEITIEVKASRAVDADSREALAVKALSWASPKPFDMNFQQVKPKCCDVFVWIAVWRDVIRHWVLSSNEVETNRYYSRGQHRGNIGEGQLHINKDNIQEFNDYMIEPNQLETAIISAYQRQADG